MSNSSKAGNKKLPKWLDWWFQPIHGLNNKGPSIALDPASSRAVMGRVGGAIDEAIVSKNESYLASEEKLGNISDFGEIRGSGQARKSPVPVGFAKTFKGSNADIFGQEVNALLPESLDLPVIEGALTQNSAKEGSQEKQDLESAVSKYFASTCVPYARQDVCSAAEDEGPHRDYHGEGPVLEDDLPKEPQFLVEQDREYYELIDKIVAKKPGAIRELREKYGVPKKGLRTLLKKWGIENAPEEEVGSGEIVDYIPLESTFRLHSNPGAAKTIYLDFDGFTANGTSWNNSYGDPIVSPSYDTDGDPSSFSISELERIQNIYARVSEDFSGFDVNVTTEDPGEAALVNTGGGDNEWGIRVVITVDDFANCGCGGFAYVGSFNWSYQSAEASDTPTYVFNTSEIGVAAAISHEVGHTLGLSHDGSTVGNVAYYDGHGSGETSWGPIMGSGYYSNVTTWDRGEYIGANNGEDDIGIITTNNGFGFRLDDHGDTFVDASEIDYVGSNAIDSSLIDVSLYGVIENQFDIDMIRFDTGAGEISFLVNSYVNLAYVSNDDGSYSSSLADTYFSTSWSSNQGSNLDVELRLYDSIGNVLAMSNPTGLNASLTQQVNAGTYYLSIDGSGFGDPSQDPPTGYTDYASTGQYFVSGTINPTGLTLSVIADFADKAEGNTGSTPFMFIITMSEAQSEAVTVDWTVIDIGGADASDFFEGQLPEGQVTFEPGVTSIPITINVNGDIEVEANEAFAVQLSSPTLGEVFSGAVGNIQADDAELQGRVWNDQNADGAVNAGEVGLAGVTVFIDANGNALLDAGEASTSTDTSGDYTFAVAPGTYQIATDLTSAQTQTFASGFNTAIEPDDFAAGSLLNTVNTYATLSAVGSGVVNNNVSATSATYTSTGFLNFGSSWNNGLWNTGDAELRVDFISPVNTVSIDFISDDSSDFGHLRAYSFSGELLQEYVTSDLGPGVVETMTILRNSSDIDYVLASGYNGQFGWLDNLQFSGSDDSIEVTVGPEISSNHDFGVNVSTVNTPPVAVTDTASTDEDNSVTISVLDNDTDPDSDQLTIQDVTQGTNGSVTFTGTDVVYSPFNDFNGSDFFAYTILDGNGGTDSAIVNVTINSVNDAPVANHDEATTTVGESVMIDVLANDTDVDNGDTKSVESFEQPKNGSVERDGSQLVYTPNVGFSGQDTFTYVTVDGEGMSSTPATVTVSVNQPAGGITIDPLELSTQEGGSDVTFTVTLDTTPTHEVRIPISSSDETEGTVNLAEIVFAAGSTGPQLVTVTPVDDLLVDGEITYSIVIGPAISSDLSYNGLKPIDVSVRNGDNDIPVNIDIYADADYQGLILGSMSGQVSNTVELGGDVQTIAEAEVQVGGSSRKPKFGSALEYQWFFPALVDATSFRLTGYKSSSSDDNFNFAYSADGGTSWTSLGQINQTSTQEIVVANLSLSGDILVRVTDTDRTAAKGSAQPILDSVSIDQIYFNSTTNDLREAVMFEATDVAASESDTSDTAIFTVSRDGSDGDLTVFYAISLDQTAVSGVDYQPLSGSVLIQDGANSASIEIVPIDDIEAEGAESVILNLIEDDAYAYKVNGSGSASVSIIDDDLTSYVATSEAITSGAIIENNFSATYDQDGTLETLQERQSGGKNTRRTSYLEHTWRFDNITGAQSFTLVAKRSDNNEGDDFAFEYSSDESQWTSLVTVESSDLETYATNLGGVVDGIIYVRAKDTDPSSPGNGVRDSLSIDYMAFSTASIPAASTDDASDTPLIYSDQADDDILSGFLLGAI